MQKIDESNEYLVNNELNILMMPMQGLPRKNERNIGYIKSESLKKQKDGTIFLSPSKHDSVDHKDSQSSFDYSKFRSNHSNQMVREHSRSSIGGTSQNFGRKSSVVYKKKGFGDLAKDMQTIKDIEDRLCEESSENISSMPNEGCFELKEKLQEIKF